MRVITKRGEIANCLAQQLSCARDPSSPRWFAMSAAHRPRVDVLADLEALDPKTCSASDVAKALGWQGLAGWVDTKCGECGAEREAVVEFFDDASDESGSVRVCASCLSKAYAAVGEAMGE